MNGEQFFFKGVTLLITHFNRTGSLQRLLTKLKELNLHFEEIVVSDDCSEPENLSRLTELSEIYGFRMITSAVNKGLGNNMNKGQDAVKTPYTLYIQEDFIPEALFPDTLKDSVQFLENDPGLDLVRFFSNFKYPYMKSFNKNFGELFVPLFGANYNKIYAYSDNPHLRRSTYFEKFGRFREGIPGDRTEYYMCVSFIKNKGKALLYKDFHSLFTHVNFSEEPSTMKRAGGWKQSNTPLIKFAKNMYRQLRYNFDINFIQFIIPVLIAF